MLPQASTPHTPVPSPFAFSLTRIVRANLDCLTLRRVESLTLAENLALVMLHAFGVFALLRYFQLPLYWFALFLLAVVLLQRWRVFAFSLATLAPLFFVYAIFVIRFFYLRLGHRALPGYFDYLLPDWRLPFLHLESGLVAAIIYILLALAAQKLLSRSAVTMLVAVTLFLLTFSWASAEYIGHRTHGVTASDPYAYAQMGVDLATRATPAHRFALFPEIISLQIPWYPIMHVGYHLPMNVQGDAVTVWPIGGAFAYAAAFRLFGEEGLYWVNPLFSLCGVMLSALLAWELTRGSSKVRRALITSITGALVATANEQVYWSVITMVDAQAQVFSLLSLYFALRARRDGGMKFSLFAGFALGAAYWVRHTQLVLIPGVFIILWWNDLPRRERLRAIFLSGAAALFVALPDLWYHQLYLGGWFVPESEELALFSIWTIPDTAAHLYQLTFAGYEFGWLAPFLIWGAAQYGRRARVEFFALALWVGLSLALHLPYAALRLRDLLAEYPALAFITSYGAVVVATRFLSSSRWRIATAFVLFASLELFTLRVWNTVPLVWLPPPPNFGYVTASQRAAFNVLVIETPSDALIGSTLNDGAIELYAQRETFRPDGWNSAQLRAFLEATRARHSSIYLLEDSGAMDGVLRDLRTDTRLARVTMLDVPLFGDASIEQPGALWKIELETPSAK